ncbi:YgfZ/GcvT domain-containing protein [Litorimonas sp. RW-G-Af-16]|uniref:CAF17-like 4Fe-4S cluster assembly/insertion protein YgfZ n=1 Tax=Litorimonas sp. RW-G-Af-16 TaxID=3241168 RepID=UPI00390C4A85
MPIASLDRTVIRLSGDGVVAWLEGLITNDLSAPLTFAALLTPQGKIIADFFVAKHGDELLLDTPTKFAADLQKRLRMYRLRAPIEIEETDLNVFALWDGDGNEGLVDPRHASLGRRLIAKDYLDGDGDYNAHRLSLGVVDSTWDFESQTTFPADANMDLMHGVNFSKGCFVGQEVVSRMKRMTTVKKRMRGLILNGAAKAGDRIFCAERVVGDVVSVHGQMGMGLIRLDRWKAAAVEPTINDVIVKIMESIDGNSA